MAPFRKPQRPTFYVWPTLPGFGRVGPWSTGVRSLRLAESVEAWLRDIAMSDPEIVRGIIAGSYSLSEAYVAAKERRLEVLKERASDPPLSEVIDRARSRIRDRRMLDGLSLLESYRPARGARFSWLTIPRHLTRMLGDGVAGREGLQAQKTNSVRRSLYAAVKNILEHELSPGRKAQITAEVVFKREDDTRDVDVTPEQIQALLDACDVELRDVVEAAILTGVDRGPLLGLTPAKVDLELGEVRVPDTKNAARPRTLPLSDPAVPLFRRLVAGKGANEPIFRLSAVEVSTRFRAARAAAGLSHVRFKDLRHVFANAWVDSGGTLKGLSDALGHTRASTSLRYTSRQRRIEHERMNLVAEKLGLAKPHLRVEQREG